MNLLPPIILHVATLSHNEEIATKNFSAVTNSIDNTMNSDENKSATRLPSAYTYIFCHVTSQ